MHITLAGISHKTAPVAARERFAFASEELPAALPRLGAAFDGGVALLSTCNRTEVYLAGPHAVALAPVVRLLGELKGATDVPEASFYHHAGRDAARHLFRVAAGVESMVLGESEILGQVRSAFASATAAGTHNAVLSQLFHGAIRVGRRARSQTHIGRYAVSVSSTAVALARKTLGDLACRTVLVVSAGEAGKLAARSLAESGASRLLVTSRTAGRAQELAADLGGETVPFERLPEAIADADIVISSSAAPDFLIGTHDVREAAAGRDGRPLLLIDIAVPRDIDPAVRGLPGVHLYDIDDLQGQVERNMNARRREAAKVERIVEEAVERFASWQRDQGVVPTVAALRARADALREAEVGRTLKRLNGLSPAQRRSVEAMANALAKKLLHDPIIRLKGHDGERYVAAARELFRLDGDGSAATRSSDTED
jgi:glutamyl-tRNA reductase